MLVYDSMQFANLHVGAFCVYYIGQRCDVSLCSNFWLRGDLMMIIIIVWKLSTGGGRRHVAECGLGR